MSLTADELEKGIDALTAFACQAESHDDAEEIKDLMLTGVLVAIMKIEEVETEERMKEVSERVISQIAYLSPPTLERFRRVLKSQKSMMLKMMGGGPN